VAVSIVTKLRRAPASARPWTFRSPHSHPRHLV